MTSRRTALLAAVALAGTLPVLALGGLSAQAAGDDTARLGSFAPLFEEPTKLAGDVKCKPADGKKNCKPAAMAIAQLSDGSLLYWDGLEGMNRVKFDVVAEFGHVALNDQSRLLTLGRGGPKFGVPHNVRSNFGNGSQEFIPGVPVNNSKGNDSDLFCAALVQLANGDVLVAGGTGYYQEPGVPGTPYGMSELEGLHMSRLFDPDTKSWKRAGDMHYGRWYPSLVTLPNGKVFVASGVTKLLKPMYPDRPMDSGTNVKQTETYNPNTKKWTVNGNGSAKSLPLFPRLHLLPNGDVYYDAGGQTFNPMGQSYDEALWNLASVYDPKSHTWSDLGVPTIGGLPLGFRGSAFSVMLPMHPNGSGRYTKSEFLSAGGVIGVSPGSYVATDTSTLNTVTTANGKVSLKSEATGTLNNARWYSTGVVLPTGLVFAVNGTTADEVVGPGSSFPVKQSEIYNPATKKWSVAATETHGRAYHNTAILLPDGRVLVGGQAPIATGYSFQTDLGADTVGTTTSTADPTFQIYSPPYLFWGPRPVIGDADRSIGYGSAYRIETDDAGSIGSVVLVRNTSLTHLIDGDQRTVELKITDRSANAVKVAVPGPKVLPAGPYELFVNKRSPKGLIPSVARQTFVGAPVPNFAAAASALKGGRSARAERAAAAATTHHAAEATARTASRDVAAGAPASHSIAAAPAAATEPARRTSGDRVLLWVIAAAGVAMVGVPVLRRRRSSTG